MTDILHRSSVLVINRHYGILGLTTPKQAFVSMCSTSDGENLAAKAVIIDYAQGNDGNYLFDSPLQIAPVFWEEWIKQPIRPFDNYISTTKQKIRIPSVLQAHNCTKIGMRHFKPTSQNLLKRYGGKCAYSGKILTPNSMTKDHVIPKSRWKELGKSGSPDSWDNLVPCDKEINHKKGNKLNHEAGLTLLEKHSEPRPVPASELIKEIRSVDWGWFVFK